LGDSAGVGAAVGLDASGVKGLAGDVKDEAEGPLTPPGWAVGWATGVWPKALRVKRLRTVRIKQTLFIGNFTLIKVVR
jgi:hypothetical protein